MNKMKKIRYFNCRRCFIKFFSSIIILSIIIMFTQPRFSKADDTIGDLTREMIAEWLTADMGVITVEKTPAIINLLYQTDKIPGTTTNWIWTLATLYYISKWQEDWQNCQGSMVMYNALSRASLFAFSKSLSAIGFGAVGSVSGLALTPIKMGLDSFLKGTIDDAFIHNEILYQRAIAMGYDLEFILAGKSNVDITFTDDGWICCVLDGQQCFAKRVLGRTPLEVYTTIATGVDFCQNFSQILDERDQLIQMFAEQLTTTAAFTSTPLSGKVPLEVSFDGSLSSPEEGLSITSWQWNFGDGHTADNMIVNHEFQEPGEYRVTLTVADSNGNNSIATKTIRVNSPVHADFSISPDRAAPGTEVNFESNSYDENGEILTFKWTFGDGISESGEDLNSVTHLYTDENYYMVTLQVTGSSGYTDTITKAVPIGYGGPTYVSGHTIDSHTKWSAYFSPYIITGSINISQNGRLDIEPGTAVKFQAGGSISASGILLATETTFTWADEGSEWSGIKLYCSNESRLEGCLIEHARGVGDLVSGAVQVWNCSPVVTGCTIQNCSGGTGISAYVYQSNSIFTPTFTNNSISGLSQGIYVHQQMSPNITGNTISNNGYGVSIHYSNDNHPILRGNTYSDNESGDICVSGSIGKHVTWEDTGTYFVGVGGGITIQSDARLSIVSGTTVKFASNSNITVNGVISATETTFTWADEGSEWSGIKLYCSNESRLEGCLIEHARGVGDLVSGAVQVWNCSPVVTGCTIQNCSGGTGISAYVYQSNSIFTPTFTNNSISGLSQGIYVHQQMSPIISGNRILNNGYGIYTSGGGTYDGNFFAGNSLYGLYNFGSNTISAINCDWGDPSGPYDPSDDRSTGGLYNPDGLGDKVSDKVLYMPWATLEKLIISASAGENGEISPSGEVNVWAGQDASFSITASEGYIISDVLVDGVPVGAVSNYTFSNISADHSIQASFINKISPTNPFPENESSSLPLDTVFSWAVADPHSVATTTYNVYFGTAPDQMILVSEGQMGISFNPGLLNGGITYYWKIVATDVYGVRIEGPVWRFTTESILAGDIDYSGNVDFKDAILAFRIAIGLAVEQTVYPAADIDGDGAIGLPEAVYVLQRVAGVR